MADETSPPPPTAAEARGRPDGIGRPSSRSGEKVSDELRLGRSRFLDGRRRVAAMSLLSSASLGVVAAYQVGILRRIPEPPLPVLDADRVDASGEAYGFLLTPDAALGMVNAAVTLVLAGMGRADRASRTPWIPLAMAAKVTLDAVSAGFLTLEQASKHRRFCTWCLIAAAASLPMIAAAVPEASAAVAIIRARRR